MDTFPGIIINLEKFQSLNLKEERKSHSEKQKNFVTILVCFPGKYQNPLIFRI